MHARNNLIAMAEMRRKRPKKFKCDKARGFHDINFLNDKFFYSIVNSKSVTKALRPIKN